MLCGVGCHAHHKDLRFEAIGHSGENRIIADYGAVSHEEFQSLSNLGRTLKRPRQVIPRTDAGESNFTNRFSRELIPSRARTISACVNATNLKEATPIRRNGCLAFVPQDSLCPKRDDGGFCG